jgi:hypothetical protein
LTEAIDQALSQVWRAILSKHERKQWSQYEQGKAQPPTAILEKLDELIIHQAATFGWRLVLSPIVHSRFAQWGNAPQGPELFDCLGKALARSALILQGRKKPPIADPGLRLFKRDMVRELRKVVALLVRRSSQKLGPDRLVKEFQAVVNEGQDAPLLKANLESWLEFLRSNEAAWLSALSSGRRVSAAGLFDAWRAWAMGYDPETVRQKISSLPK